MQVTLKFWSKWHQSLVTPLLFIVAINVAWFLLGAKVGMIVGTETGTDGYKEIAENVVRGHGLVYSQGMRSTIEYGHMKREPIYPLLLAVILRLTGTLSPVVLGLFQTFFALISCYLLYHLGEKTFGTSTGRLASFMYALHPISFWYSTRFASEIVTVTAVLLCLLCMVNFFAEPTRIRAVQVGLSLGVAVLTRSACVVFLPVILLFVLLQWWTQRGRLLSCVFIMVFFYASIHSLWLIRNYAISGETVPFTTNSGAIFFYGNEVVKRFDVKKYMAEIDEADNAAQALYRAVQDDIAAKVPHMSLPRLEAQTNQQLIAMARQFVVEEPFFVVRKFLSGMYFIWFLSSSTAKSWGWMMFQMPLLAFAIIGSCQQRQWNVSQRFLLCVVVVYVIPYALLLALARYSMPIIPVVILFASYGLVSFLKLDGGVDHVPDSPLRAMST